MKVVLLRVGVDSSFGESHGPLFKDNKFEFIPIPDPYNIGSRKYGNTSSASNKSKNLIDYFPTSKMKDKSIHWDPEFETKTYGEPNPHRRRLRELEAGDILGFYSGLQSFKDKYDSKGNPELYLIGYFEVEKVWMKERDKLPDDSIMNNFHIKYMDELNKENKEKKLIVIKGTAKSRLYKQAYQISRKVSCLDKNKKLYTDYRLTYEMEKVFGQLTGKGSIKRSSARLINENFVDTAARFLKSLN